MSSGHEETDPPAPRPISAVAAARRAVDQFTALTDRVPETVTGLRGTEGGGWSALIDVVELVRVPDSTSVLATYRVDLDDQGDLQSYERLRRFHRGATDAG